VHRSFLERLSEVFSSIPDSLPTPQDPQWHVRLHDNKDFPHKKNNGKATKKQSYIKSHHGSLMESSRSTRSSRWWTWKDLRKCFEAFVERTEATLNVNTVFPPKGATFSFGSKKTDVLVHEDPGWQKKGLNNKACSCRHVFEHLKAHQILAILRENVTVFGMVKKVSDLQIRGSRSVTVIESPA